MVSFHVESWSCGDPNFQAGRPPSSKLRSPMSSHHFNAFKAFLVSSSCCARRSFLVLCGSWNQPSSCCESHEVEGGCQVEIRFRYVKKFFLRVEWLVWNLDSRRNIKTSCVKAGNFSKKIIPKIDNLLSSSPSKNKPKNRKNTPQLRGHDELPTQTSRTIFFGKSLKITIHFSSKFDFPPEMGPI